MASTSVHFPEDLVRRLDELARETGVSRNRLIVEACESLVQRARGEWPADFFSDRRVNSADGRLLRSSLKDWSDQIMQARRNRSVGPF